MITQNIYLKYFKYKRKIVLIFYLIIINIMDDTMQIGLNLISNITDYKKDFNPNDLFCGICYCICFDPMQCKNKKCGTLCCKKCYDKLEEENYWDDVLKCPFCRMMSGYRNAYEIEEIIKKLKFYCERSVFCTEEYNQETLYEKHQHLDYYENEDNMCHKCFKIYDLKDPNHTKCAICLQLFCFENINPLNSKFQSNEKVEGHIKKCYNCHLGICDSHINFKEDINFLCELCEKNEDNICELCKIKKAKRICSFCSKKLCPLCIKKCECNLVICKNDSCIKPKAKSCSDCSKFLNNLNNNICVHSLFLNCSRCYKKCDICRKNITNDFCDDCNKRICVSTCCARCESCKDIFCKYCTQYCSICKSIICFKCGDTCNSCKKSLVSCRNCKSNAIKQCCFVDNKIQCVKRLCMQCWKTCNTCHKVYCDSHINKCYKCEEYFCELHHYFCEKCSNEKDEKYKKLCLKKCSTQCVGCDNIINDFCKKENHPKDFIEMKQCGHYVCNSCQINCSKCKKELIKCPQCIGNNLSFEQCLICGLYLCNQCCGHCNKCNNDYCNFAHKCVNCGKEKKECFHCIVSLKKNCKKCKEKIKVCINCNKLFFCDEKCYIQFKQKKKNEKDSHLCPMYLCEKHQ